jgi:hypothetical protein
LWAVMSYGFVCRYQRFGGKYCLHFQGWRCPKRLYILNYKFSVVYLEKWKLFSRRSWFSTRHGRADEWVCWAMYIIGVLMLLTSAILCCPSSSLYSPRWNYSSTCFGHLSVILCTSSYHIKYFVCVIFPSLIMWFGILSFLYIFADRLRKSVLTTNKFSHIRLNDITWHFFSFVYFLICRYSYLLQSNKEYSGTSLRNFASPACIIIEGSSVKNGMFPVLDEI